METGPGGSATSPRDAAGPGETVAVPPAAGQEGDIRPDVGQNCPSFAGFIHILMCSGFAPRGHEENPVFCATGACEAACPAKNSETKETKPA